MKKPLIYLEALSLEENKQIDLIRRCLNNSTYEQLSYTFYKIENGLPLHGIDRVVLAENWYYGDTFTIEEIRQWIKITYFMLEDSANMSIILFQEAISELINSILNKINTFLNKVNRKWQRLVVRKILK